MRLADADARDGESLDVETSPRLTDAQLRRARDLWMLRMRQTGYATDDIAKLFNLHPEHVRRRLRGACTAQAIAG
jgi:hypothetical protein